MKFRNLFFALSLFVIVPSIISLVLFGFKLSIDFVGGSLLEVGIKKEVQAEAIHELLSLVYEINSVSRSDTEAEQNRFVIEGTDILNETKVVALEKLRTEFGEVSELRFESVGPTLSKELLIKTLTALVLVAGIITVYVWRQFSELKYGVCAILAMMHDSIVLLGSFSLLGYFLGVQVDVLFVTALLTTLSFSVHDTIVVYDRIRELRKKQHNVPYKTIVNMAVVETLGRSINNSVTIIIMLATLALLGGATIKWFAVALLIGAITGTYSSTFTAAPLLLLWEDIIEKRNKK